MIFQPPKLKLRALGSVISIEKDLCHMGSRLEKWERKLYQLLGEIDDYLEEKYAGRYRLHPARPARGTTSSKSHDGLFNINANFSLGLGSRSGRGYSIDVELVTLEDIDPAVEAEINHIVVQQIRKKLPAYFPERELQVTQDGNLIKIYGDLSLGTR